MKKLKSRLGITMAEMLIVVAIVAILGGLSFIAVWNYQRSLGQLERDGIAKEIFVAAQNHLTAAFGEGYLGIAEPDPSATGSTAYGIRATDGAYYFAVNGFIQENTVLALMLPFGSIDETVRIGGSYILRYQPKTGKVLDVFYCTRSGRPERFNHSLQPSEYDTVMGLTGEAHKSDRRTYVDGENSILGWYGGEGAAELPGTTLAAPSIKIVNAEKLYVEVTNPNSGNTDAKLKLIITGTDSKAQKAYTLQMTSLDDRVKFLEGGSSYTIILDDITSIGTMERMHFADIVADTQGTNGKKFIPGENIEIQAVAYSNSALANVAYSAKGTTNSLFGDINSAKDTAYIGNIRHLENLDRAISKLDDNDSSDLLVIQNAEQTDSFSWPGFQKGIRRIESKYTSGTESEDGYATVRVYNSDGTPTTAGYYMPIKPNYSLSYDGKGHSISGVAVTDADCDDAGLFGSVTAVKEIKNLELIDFSVKGKNTAGTLAGSLTDCNVTNVLARNSTRTDAVNVAANIAGGLVGSMPSGTLQFSAAAVVVGQNAKEASGDIPAQSATIVAGGLVGTADGEIIGCYAGGHTDNGSYEAWVKNHPYDVTGLKAGGLVGSSSAAISDSYSTCSVSGSEYAGGFVAEVLNGTNAKISNCYATGLIDQTKTTATKYAFIASGMPATCTDNLYFSVVNQVPKEGGAVGETELMLPVNGYVLNEANMARIKPLDLNTETYNIFVGAPDEWNPARAYDPALVQYYGGKYCLKAVDELHTELPDGYTSWDDIFVITHYGDWPSPEVFFINTES